METTVEKAVDALVAQVDTLAGRAKPGVRDILVDDEVRRVQVKWQVDDIDALDPKYIDRLRAKKEREYDEENRTIDKEIAPQFAPLREAIGQRLAAARRIPLESERVNPDAAPQHFATARLLDEFSQDRAERWLSAHEGDLAAIEARYQASDDRRDAAFVRLVEDGFGLTSETPTDESGRIALVPLRTTVRARQDARIPASLRDAIAKLDTAENVYKMARVEAFPSTATLTAAVGGLIGRRAK
jgi:hypothetical protein